MVTKTTLTSKLDKGKLINATRNLLHEGSVKTQEDICRVLREQGFEVNQAKMSRVLHKLGAIKVTEENQVVYRLPAEFLSVNPKNSLNQVILSIVRNEVLIVINTTPGSAQLIAGLLDRQKEPGILGTVAGDDTIFIVPKEVGKIQEVLQKVSRLLLG